MLNKWTGIGFLGQDPETKHFDNGSKVVNVTMATSESYKNKQGEKVENTEWTNLVIYGHTADFVEKYLKKGDKVYVEGPKRTRSYENKEGNKVYVTEVVIDNFKGALLALGSKSDNSEAPPIDDLAF